MPTKRLTDRQIRAILRKEAKEDPESWAAIAITAADKAREGLRVAQRGYMGRALGDVQKAEALERQVLARYVDPEPKKPAKNKQPAPEQSPTDTEAALREQLRTEHKDQPADSTDPATEAKNAGEDEDEPRSLGRTREAALSAAG